MPPQQGLQQQNQPPIAVAYPQYLTVSENATAMLDGRQSYDPDVGGTIAGYQWIQLMPIERVPIVELQGPNTANPTFVTPFVTQDTLLAFDLTVIDNNGVPSPMPNRVYVLIKNIIDESPNVNNFLLPQLPLNIDQGQYYQQEIPGLIPPLAT